MPKRRRKFGRCPSHFLDRKRRTPRTPVRPPRMPANPASSVTPSPRSRQPKRKLTTLELEIELNSSRIKHRSSERLLVKERAKKQRLTNVVDQQVLLRARDKTTSGRLRDLLADTRKGGRRLAQDVINASVKISKLESNSKVSSFNSNQERSCYLLWNTYLPSFSSTFKADTQLLTSNTIHTSSVKELNTKQDALIEDLKRENKQLLYQDKDNKGKMKWLTTQKNTDKKA